MSIQVQSANGLQVALIGHHKGLVHLQLVVSGRQQFAHAVALEHHQYEVHDLESNADGKDGAHVLSEEILACEDTKCGLDSLENLPALCVQSWVKEFSNVGV